MVDIKRPEDMGGGSLLLFKQEDGDWIIRIVGRNLADNLVTCSIEFCTPMMGGGASPKTWEALEKLAQAMMEDNAAPARFGMRAEHSEANVPALATRGLEPAAENHAGDGQPSGLPAAHGSASEKFPTTH